MTSLLTTAAGRMSCQSRSRRQEASLLKRDKGEWSRDQTKQLETINIVLLRKKTDKGMQYFTCRFNLKCFDTGKLLEIKFLARSLPANFCKSIRPQAHIWRIHAGILKILPNFTACLVLWQIASKREFFKEKSIRSYKMTFSSDYRFNRR